MSLGQIIDYFRNELRNKLVRPVCQKQLTLWDHSCWIKSNNINIYSLINSNDFLQFWFRTCFELCCVNDVRAIVLKNALDKYFYFLIDFENYFKIFISKKAFTTRKQIMDAVIDYNLDNNNLKSKVKRNKKTQNLFVEFVNRVNEWNYWKKIIIIQFIKINIGKAAYKAAEENSIDGLTELIRNTEKLWDKGIQGNTIIEL